MKAYAGALVLTLAVGFIVGINLFRWEKEENLVHCQTLGAGCASALLRNGNCAMDPAITRKPVWLSFSALFSLFFIFFIAAVLAGQILIASSFSIALRPLRQIV